MTEKDLNEVAPWGKTWGRTSKREYKNIAAENQLKLKEIETNKIQAELARSHRAHPVGR